MIAFLLISIATFLEEVAVVAGKRAVAEKKESLYSFGFLNAFWLIIFMALSVAVLHKPFHFSTASLPFFIPHFALQIVQAHLIVKATLSSDRSTFAFLRIITIPILLAIDLILGYSISSLEIAGVVVIFMALALLLSHHALRTSGGKYVIATALLAPITLSLYKYNITHYNSVAAETIIIFLGVLVYFTIGAWYHGRERTWTYLFKERFELQSIISGLGMAMLNYAFALLPASIAVALGRAATTFWAIIFGNIYFHESKFKQKITGYFLLILVLCLIAVGAT